MSDRILPISLDRLLKEVGDHLAKARHLHRLSEGMRAYMLALNKKPCKPTSRMKGHLQEFLYSFMGEPINLFYDCEKSWNGTPRVKITIRNFVDEEVRYQLEYSETYEVDVERSMTGHAGWGEIVTDLTAKQPMIPQKVAEFNAALETLCAVAAFAKPEGRLYPLYPLSQHFHWYELPHS